jgi:hypothetical protein
MYCSRVRKKNWSDLQALLVCSWKLAMFTPLQKCNYLRLVSLSPKKSESVMYKQCYLVTSNLHEFFCPLRTTGMGRKCKFCISGPFAYLVQG